MLYLDGLYCNNHAGTSKTWGTADFTGATENCGFYDSAGHFYAADDTNTAWEIFPAVNPDAVVDATYFIQDQPGKDRIDCLALGSGAQRTKGTSPQPLDTTTG